MIGGGTFFFNLFKGVCILSGKLFKWLLGLVIKKIVNFMIDVRSIKDYNHSTVKIYLVI